MPVVSSAELAAAVLRAIQKSGGTGFYISESESRTTHPREFLIQYGEDTISLWIYLWNLTFGGRPSLPDEYRIQMTAVSPPLSINSNGFTILLGYYSDLDAFAGFDIERHRIFTEGSSSVQVDINTVRTASEYGLAFSKKDNQEVVVGIRPDQFLNYVFNADSLHEHGGDPSTHDLLSRASRGEEIKPQEIEHLAEDRQNFFAMIIRQWRESSFRRRVLEAYESRCAVTREQLNLVDAAHIVPVASLGTHDVTNGIALSPTMHRAYDRSLIYLDEEYYMRLNKQKADELKSLQLGDGLNHLCSYLDSPIHLPSDEDKWPDPEFIREANKLRKIQGYY